MDHEETHAFVALLQRHFASIRREVLALDLEREFLEWPDRRAYSGSWRVFPLFFAAEPFLPVDAARNRARCPETARVLASLDTLEGAAFSVLGPHSRVLRHVDHPSPGVVRCHLALCVPSGCAMHVEEHVFPWEEGRCRIFDGQVAHEAVNPTDQPRVVLISDFRVLVGPDSHSTPSVCAEERGKGF